MDQLTTKAYQTVFSTVLVNTAGMASFTTSMLFIDGHMTPILKCLL